MNKNKTNTYSQIKKLICDWTDKKNYLIQNRMLKFYVSDGLIFDKVHEKISFRQSNRLRRYKNFTTQNITLAKMISKKTSINYFKNLSMEKQ